MPVAPRSQQLPMCTRLNEYSEIIPDEFRGSLEGPQTLEDTVMLGTLLFGEASHINVTRFINLVN